ncbi:MAG TPA: GTPase ObgE [Acidimicrobiales bacterium]|nr:GTPase ObgE [Acidimicrobiales bacterium]
MSSSFVDTAQLHAKAGNGGAGSVSFRREAHVPRGGPDGGDGGDGGDVWLVADHNTVSLLSFRDHPHRAGENGVHGQGKQKHGKRGEPNVAPVPIGTVVKDTDGEILADLHTEGMRYLAAKGGQGGRGNARFLSNKRRAPAFAEQGEMGEERWLDLELKLMADVALVGFPNAGKSTFISAVSAAKPKIADYPFTTLEPHLGVVRLDDREMVIADIPGLIEGASTGKGLGHEFLRHIERARVLLILVDLASAEGRDPQYQVDALLRELGDYEPELLDRPRVVVGTKADAAALEWDGERISAATGEGIRPLLGQLMDLVDAARNTEPTGEIFVIHRPEPDGFRIERDGNDWVVVGRAAERAVALSDLTDLGALQYAQQRLKRLGVDRALARAGVRPGDLVRIGGFVFEYEAD